MPHTLKVLDYHHLVTTVGNTYTSKPASASIKWLIKKAKLAYTLAVGGGTTTLTVQLSDGVNTIQLFTVSATSNTSGSVELCTGAGGIGDLNNAVIDYATAYLQVVASPSVTSTVTYQLYLAGDEES